MYLKISFVLVVSLCFIFHRVFSLGSALQGLEAAINIQKEHLDRNAYFHGA
jgi:hypothetical protein